MALDTYKGSRKRTGTCCCKCYDDTNPSCVDVPFGVYDLIRQEEEGSEIMDFETTQFVDGPLNGFYVYYSPVFVLFVYFAHPKALSQI